jgi:hypothetical protein
MPNLHRAATRRSSRTMHANGVRTRLAAQRSSHCHACRKEVIGNPAICPRCAAPNPTLSYTTTIRMVATFVILIIVASSVSMLVRDTSATKPYTIGLTYRVANAGPICRTTKVLATADQNMVTTEGQAELLGCLMLVPAPSSKVTVLDKDPNLLNVRIIAPNLESDGYEGWTDVQTLGSAPDVAK